MRKTYPYDEALDDLEVFIEKYVEHQQDKLEFLELINLYRKNKTVPIRFFHEKFIKYTEKYQLYSPYENKDKDMVDDLMYFWG